MCSGFEPAKTNAARQVFACVGETFEDLDVVGVVLSVRKLEFILSIWNRDNAEPDRRFKIGERLKQILKLDPNMPIEYKNHLKSMKDRSTYRNGRTYIVS